MPVDSRSSLRYAFAGMVAMVAAMGLGRFVYTPLLPGMMEGIGLTAADAGLIASANYLGYLVGALGAGGGWAEGRERTMALAGLCASAVLSAAMGLAGDLAFFLPIRFLAGVASAFVMVFLGTIVLGRLAALGRDDLQWLFFGGVGLGIAVSALVAGAMELAGAAWPQGWYWSGVLSLAAFLAVLRLLGRAPASRAVNPEPRLAASPALVRVILAQGLFGAGYIVTATFLVAIVREGEGGRLFESAVWLAAGLAGVPSVWLWNRIARRIGLLETFALACLVEAVGVTASVTLGGHLGPLVGGVLLGGTFIAITAFGLQAARRFAGASPRRALAVMTVAFGLGQIVGPLAAGLLADRTGSFFAPSLGASALLLLAAIIALATRRLAKAG